MVRFNFFLCYFRSTCAKCTCGYFRKALFDGMPHVENFFFCAFCPVEKEHRKQKRAYAMAMARREVEKSHRDSTHIAAWRAIARTPRLSSRGSVCMGKTIFMGTIKPNCFNLIGNFSSFCWLSVRLPVCFASSLFGAAMHLIDKQGGREIVSARGILHVLISGDFIHNWYVTGWMEGNKRSMETVLSAFSFDAIISLSTLHRRPVNVLGVFIFKRFIS